MKITLETVREVLRETFGFESFIAAFLVKIKEGKEIATAGISKEGILYYNPEFTQKYITSKKDLFSLIFHEILHSAFSHFIYGNGAIENMACDSVINAVISEIYGDYSADGALFKKLYNSNGIEGLLRPESNLEQSRFSSLYSYLYKNRCGDNLTTGEIINTLKILIPPGETISITLLGSHSGKEGKWGLPQEIISKIVGDIKRNMPERGRNAGYSKNISDLFMEALKTHLSIKKILLSRYSTRRKIDHFKELFKETRRTVSPIPIYPSKRDLVLLSTGIYPGYFHNNVYKVNYREKGIACYLDVSGSVNEYLPKILGILRNLQKELKSIFLFSNKVVEVPFTTLMKGEIQTTYGTDFDCIAESILEREYEKAVVITDGYASLGRELSEKLKKQGVCILTILFDRRDSCDDFAPFGEVLKLDDVTG